MSDKGTIGEITTAHLFAWVQAGLLRYQQQSLAVQTAEIKQYEERIATALTGYPDMQWQEINQVLADRLQSPTCGPGVLVSDAATDLPQLFLFILCSAIELERDVANRMAVVQNTGHAGWLQVGYAKAIVEFLFALPEATDLTQYQLVTEGLLIVKGQGPYVTRSLYTSADYWHAINDRRLLPEFSAVTDYDIALDETLTLTSAELLRRKNLLAVETDHKTAEAMLLALSRQMDLHPIAMDYADWQQKSLRALLRYAGWLPLIRCDKSEATLLDEMEDFTPGILLIRSDQQLPDTCLRVEIPHSATDKRRQWWQQWITDDQALTSLAASSLSQAAVRRIGLQLLRPNDDDVLQQIRRTRNTDGTAHLKRVAIPVDTWVTEDMLIFPQETHASLEQCFQRTLERDYQRLGMGDSIKATANTGVMLLFSGASGTGKTLASSWLASRLGAPLFKIDLAMIMNKYVGETEKNLALALDEAAKSDVILLFDEADALFGKRSDGSHGGDRYANMLTNYLLSRIETHPGIVILTTNAGSRMDSAFQRRIDIAVEFLAMPYKERIRLWEAMLATRNPGKALCQRIARYCELPPGHVRNVVINACCWNPGEVPLSAHAIWQGLEEEYRKVGRSMPSQLMALKNNRFSIRCGETDRNDG